MLTVLTVYTDDILPYLKYNTANVSAWAARHGYNYRLEKIPESFDRSPHWAKISMAAELLKDGEPLFVMDADMLIQRPEIGLGPFLRKMRSGKKLIGLCDDKPNGGHINTGSMLLEGDPVTRELLKEWWTLGEDLDLSWEKYHEQDTLVYMMKQRRVNDLVHIFGAREFNSVCDDWKPDEFIAHYMAKSTQEKTQLMKDRFAQLEG